MKGRTDCTEQSMSAAVGNAALTSFESSDFIYIYIYVELFAHKFTVHNISHKISKA